MDMGLQGYRGGDVAPDPVVSARLGRRLPHFCFLAQQVRLKLDSVWGWTNASHPLGPGLLLRTARPGVLEPSCPEGSFWGVMRGVGDTRTSLGTLGCSGPTWVGCTRDKCVNPAPRPVLCPLSGSKASQKESPGVPVRPAQPLPSAAHLCLCGAGQLQCVCDHL